MTPLHIPPARIAGRLLLVAGSLLLYVLLFWILFPTRGPGIAALGLLPALISGGLLGLRGGLLASLLIALLPTPLLALLDEEPLQLLLGQTGGLGSIMLVAVGAAAGWASDINRELHHERERADQLLLNVLPPSIAERLKREPGIIADSHEDVTILFADIVNFSRLSGRVSPRHLVKMLNRLFSMFDELVERHQLEKIKTIGDTYMVVGGVPTPRADHPEAVATFALEMLEAVCRFNQEQNTTLNLRVGIATGPVIAGVLGTRKFSYDLWGDTVNVASRMESHGVPGRIQITVATYKRLRHHFNFEKRGMIDVKGKGQMATYFLLGKKEQ
ncbi:MAG: hypothetical protein H0T73_07170 [Ardenticatenales bacterium]|nr:hypothetical protein [Ardenticatenales bacterium]